MDQHVGPVVQGSEASPEESGVCLLVDCQNGGECVLGGAGHVHTGAGDTAGGEAELHVLAYQGVPDRVGLLGPDMEDGGDGQAGQGVEQDSGHGDGYTGHYAEQGGFTDRADLFGPDMEGWDSWQDLPWQDSGHGTGHDGQGAEQDPGHGAEHTGQGAEQGEWSYNQWDVARIGSINLEYIRFTLGLILGGYNHLEYYYH